MAVSQIETQHPRTQPRPSSAAPTQSRSPTLDAARVLAAVAVLWMHSWNLMGYERTGEVGRFAVPFFTLSAVFLLAQSLFRNPDRAFLPYVVNRFRRLYLPFLGWAAIGIGAMLVKYRFVTHRSFQPLDVSDLLTGRSFQLWFLPFLVAACVAMFPLCRMTAHLHRKWPLGLIVLVVGAALACVPFNVLIHVQPSAPLSEFKNFCRLSWTALPSVFWGLAFATWLRIGRVSNWLAAAGVVATILASALVVAYGRNTFLETTAGAGWLFFGLARWKPPLATIAASLPFLAYGLYLSHGVVFETLRTGMLRVHLNATSPNVAAVFVLTLLLCLALCLAMNRWKWTRWMLG